MNEKLKKTLLKTPKPLHKKFVDYAYDNDLTIHDTILELAEKGLTSSVETI